MKRKAVVATVAILVVAAITIAIALRRHEERTRQPAGPASPAQEPGTPDRGPSQPSAPATPQPTPMRFTRDGVASAITQAVERVVRAGRAQVAVHPRNGGRWVCILVDARERYVELGRGLRAEDFPALQELGFRPPPTPISRTMSIYRSVAKRAMEYDVERGDRIIILLCPRAEWPTLTLHWPAAKPSRD